MECSLWDFEKVIANNEVFFANKVIEWHYLGNDDEDMWFTFVWNWLPSSFMQAKDISTGFLKRFNYLHIINCDVVKNSMSVSKHLPANFLGVITRCYWLRHWNIIIRSNNFMYIHRNEYMILHSPTIKVESTLIKSSTMINK